MPFSLRGNAAAVIGNFDEKKLSVAAGADIDSACSAHGVDRVVDKVRPNLIQFAAIGANSWKRAIESPGHLDILQLMSEDYQRILDAFMDVDFLPRRLIHERIGLYRLHELRDALRAVSNRFK